MSLSPTRNAPFHRWGTLKKKAGGTLKKKAGGTLKKKAGGPLKRRLGGPLNVALAYTKCSFSYKMSLSPARNGLFNIKGPAAFYYFSQSNQIVDLILNLLLLVFIFNFVWNKLTPSSTFYSFNQSYNEEHISKVVLRTLAFTYLNPHVYSDTIFIIGGFSRELMLNEKIFFVFGAACASFIYFFSLGYASSYFATFINNQKGWQLINRIVIFVMLLLSVFVIHKIVATLMLIT